jgi:Skp family chaperone for outer membrane proteins
MKSNLGGVFGLLSLVIVTTTQAQPGGAVSTPVRFVRSQAILSEAKDARLELERLQDMQKQKAAELRAKQQALDAARAQLAQATNAETRAGLIEDERRIRMELEQATLAAQNELQTRQRQVQASMQARVRVVLDEMLKGQDVAVVLNAETSVVWADPRADLTSAVIAKLNAGTSSDD